MNINFQTSNIVIVSYPINAGGKFLINCLALSDNAVLQDEKLARLQLSNKINQFEKYNCIKERLINVDKSWNDLGFGCLQLFGIPDQAYTEHRLTTIKNSNAFNDVIEELTHNTLKFFIVAHSPVILIKLLELWPNAKIIYFYNCEKFIKFRTLSAIEEKWKLLRGSSWPINAPESYGSYLELDKNIQEELMNFDFDVMPYYKRQLLIAEKTNEHAEMINQFPTAIHWNTDNYFSADSTIKNIRDLYDLLDLTNFNENIIREYYSLWIDKLTELKNK